MSSQVIPDFVDQKKLVQAALSAILPAHPGWILNRDPRTGPGGPVEPGHDGFQGWCDKCR
jgi:hypothetical protein